MQKLVVRNQFMGVKPCEIEIRRFLLLIGEQASGKSTIAKLIYFFQTLPDEIYKSALLDQGRGNFDYRNDINKVARSRFIDTFGSTIRSEALFNIEFWYDENSCLNIYQGQSDRLTYARFGDDMGYKLGGIVREFLLRTSGTPVEIILSRETLLKGLYQIFNQTNTIFNYIIAGRNTVVAYPDLIGEKVKNELEKLVEDEVREQDFEKKKRRGNEMIFLEFVNWSEGIRQYFRANGGTFERVRQRLAGNRDALRRLIEISNRILKGRYASNDSGESLIPAESRVPIDFKDASSGQQEVLRILQGLFVSIGLANRKEFLVIEEPEAHLYPLAQKELVNAFAVFLNTIQEGRIVITTHSPYILACVNILLFAQYVSKEIAESGHNNDSLVDIPNAYWLDASFFNAYSLGGSETYCSNIKDDETGLIDQNYLDLISEQLGLQYQQLYQMLVTDEKDSH